MNTTAVPEDLIKAFAARHEERANAHRAQHYPNTSPQTITYSLGKKYAKIIASDPGSRCVICFIDLTNGDILMAASWAKPAKHPRGNVYKSLDDGMGVYGANYLR